MPGWLRRNTPQPVPTILLGRLAVDARYQGHHIGAQLLRDAILRAQSIASELGARALVVDPIDESAAAFYRHYGFEMISANGRMAIRISDRA